MSKAARILPYHEGNGEHAVVLVHGITQSASGLSGFAEAIARCAPKLTIFLYDYDWTRPLESSGAHLAVALARLNYRQISLVGYSMGGLVSRLAASEERLDHLRTIVTLATPNRGAIGTAQLVPFAQDALYGLRFLSPLLPAPGVLDLSDADAVMRRRRDTPGVAGIVGAKRYASVPARYFHAHRPWRSGRSAMKHYSAVLSLSGLTRMERPHDGIVTERSNALVGGDDTGWSEVDYADYDGKRPARCHAFHVDCDDHDHMTILTAGEVADLVAQLVLERDWRRLRSPDVRIRLPDVNYTSVEPPKGRKAGPRKGNKSAAVKAARPKPQRAPKEAAPPEGEARLLALMGQEFGLPLEQWLDLLDKFRALGIRSPEQLLEAAAKDWTRNVNEGVHLHRTMVRSLGDEALVPLPAALHGLIKAARREARS